MSTFFEGGKKGSCLEVKFWSLYPASLENTWEISLPTAGPLKQLVFAFRILKGRPTDCSPIVGEALSSRSGLENTGLCVGVWGLKSVCLGAHCPPPAPSLHPTVKPFLQPGSCSCKMTGQACSEFSNELVHGHLSLLSLPSGRVRFSHFLTLYFISAVDSVPATI